MYYCYHGIQYREQEGICLGLSALFLYIFLEWAVSLVQAHSFLHGVICVFGMIFGLVFGLVMIMAYLEICRRYMVTESGIKLIYPFNYVVAHSWDEISEIGICKVHYTTRGPVEYLTAIRCVVGGEKKGPSKGHGWWADSLYSAIHFRRVITIVYSEERVEEFRKLCPFEVIDYRNIKYYHK